MRTILITSLLTIVLLGVVGCAENAGMQNSSDRYTAPEAISATPSTAELAPPASQQPMPAANVPPTAPNGGNTVTH